MLATRQRVGQQGGPVSKRSPNEIDVEIGKRLRTLRVARGLSQAELGRGLGIAYRQIHKYENGSGRISAGRLVELANLLDISPSLFFEDELFENEPRLKCEGEAIPELPTDKDRLAVARAFDRIRSPNVRRRVVELIEQLVDSSC
jgi:transcriptional regulator with XRE-family HTH domain